ncbi:MAG: hypothetical protein ABIQ93_11260 [Saprospiraceae bacterium]
MLRSQSYKIIAPSGRQGDPSLFLGLNGSFSKCFAQNVQSDFLPAGKNGLGLTHYGHKYFLIAGSLAFVTFVSQTAMHRRIDGFVFANAKLLSCFIFTFVSKQ